MKLGLHVVLAAVILAAVAIQRRDARRARLAARWDAAIHAVMSSPRDSGWVETFASTRSMPLSRYDGRWRDLFGRMLVERGTSAAIGDPEGGWQHDGGDDYAFRASDTPTGNVEITMDGWWDGIGSLGVQGAVQLQPPHRLYEAALWRGTLALVYFIGPTPDRYEVLAEAPGRTLTQGYYRLEFCLVQGESGWRLRARLRDALRDYAVVRELSATDNRLPGGVQGIGVLGGGGRRSSHITGMAVRYLAHTRPCSADATP